MADWKKSFAVAAGVATGTMCGFAIVACAIWWWESRPKPPTPPRPWNTTSIRAEFDDADTEGDSNTIVVYYVLENTTAFDYDVSGGASISLDARLLEEKSLSRDDNILKIDYPIDVPSHKRVRFAVHLNYPCGDKEKPDPDLAERRRHKAAVEAFMAKEFANLDGFEILDSASRYEVVLPAGWKSKNQNP